MKKHHAPLIKREECFFLACCALVFGFLILGSTHRLRQFIGREAIRIASFIGKQAGLKIDFRSHRIGFGSFAVEEVRVANDYTSTFGAIAVSVQLNPFADDFLALQQVTVERAAIKASFATVRDFLTYVICRI